MGCATLTPFFFHTDWCPALLGHKRPLVVSFFVGHLYVMLFLNILQTLKQQIGIFSSFMQRLLVVYKISCSDTNLHTVSSIYSVKNYLLSKYTFKKFKGFIFSLRLGHFKLVYQKKYQWICISGWQPSFKCQNTRKR